MSNVAKWMDEGENRVLNILLGAQAVDGTLYVGLYKNGTEPSEDLTLSSLQEPSGYGYGRKALSRGSWTITGNQAVYAETTFLANGGDWGDVWGYFICTTASGTGGKLLAIEHLGTKLSILDGKGVKVVPKITVT